MKINYEKRKGLGGNKRKKNFSINEDSFFAESKKRRKSGFNDDVIDSESEEELEVSGGSDAEIDGDNEVIEETVDEKRKRIAEEYLEILKKTTKSKKEEDEEDEDDRESEREGERDSLVAKILQQEQLEESGRVRKVIASRVKKPELSDEFRVLVKHRQSVTAVALSEDDSRGFSASKDGTIVHWDVETGKSEKYQWPTEVVLKEHGVRDPQGRVGKHSKQVLALAVSSDGRYLATGGSDRHVHLWDTRTREHLQAFPGHRGPVSCLAFRQGSTELFSGSFDRTVKIWNVEDRTYINTLHGHQSEVLTIDCLRKERVLTVGRDRAMHLFKVPEESRLVYRASQSHLECCCFINNDEFFTGSDDGNVELWGILKKKPLYVVKNAHVLPPPINKVQNKRGDIIPNGEIANGGDHAESCNTLTAYSWVSSVALCRGSDLAASGAGNGCVRLWSLESERKGIHPLHDLPLVGFVNSLAFAKSGRFIVAGVGQEPRLGRWGRLPAARNGVAIHPLSLS